MGISNFWVFTRGLKARVNRQNGLVFGAQVLSVKLPDGLEMRKTTKQIRMKPASTSLTPEDLRRKTFDRAIKLLSAKPRSVADLRGKLLQGRFGDKTVVEEVIARLSEYGYLDDERFALSYASLKVTQRPIGKRRLERDLKLRKVDGATASEALEQVYSQTSEAELIERAIEKRIRVRGRPKNRMEAKSLFDYLLRQGFPFELVSERVRALATEELAED